ncbi:hypothetical protein E2C01_056198 [Portunus trituberculatus]|uniref:Uncharacterized protein n=1 Tax=Portunus trituberculatus TaxID=210409 RepID=A0A5B7GXH2_PORTR|nr:hypothetical protein [Portunus trituberculatus]
MRHHSKEVGELLGTWEGRTPFCNNSQPSPTSWMSAQASGGASSISTACGLVWRKDTSCGASRDHPRRQTVRWWVTVV